MKNLNLKLIQFSNIDIANQSVYLSDLNNTINSYYLTSIEYERDTTTVYYDTTTDTSSIITETVPIIENLQKLKCLYGSDVTGDATIFNNKNISLFTDINDIINNKKLENNFYPNRTNKLSIINTATQGIDLSFVIDRFDIYNRLDDVGDILKLDYDNFVVEAVVVRSGITFLSNLKLMSRDIYFDLIFKNTPEYVDYFLNSVILVTDNTIYDGTSYDMDNLNLNVLNIGVVSTKDQYVSYKVSNEITLEEIEFIRTNCNLRYEFVNKYNSTQKQYVFKKILIGK